MITSMPHDAQLEPGQAPKITRTVRNIAWNYAGYAYQIAINIGVTWYIVRRVTVVEYGLFLFVMSLSATLYLLDMGISSVLVQAYVEALARGGKDRLNDLLSSAFVSLAALGTVGLLVFLGLALALPGPFKIPHGNLHEAFLIFVIAALIIQVSFPAIAIEQVYQASHRFDRTNQIQLIASTSQAALSIAVLVAGYGIVALAAVQLAASILRFLLLAAALPSSIPGIGVSLARFQWALVKPLLRLSKWALLHNLGAYFFDMFIWLILGSFASMRDAALFGLGQKLPKQVWNLVDKGANVAMPLMSQSAVVDDAHRLRHDYLKTQQLVFGAVLPFVVLGCLFARPLIVVWAGGKYADAAVVMQWLSIAALSQALTYPSDMLLYACAKVKKAASISLWSNIISILAALALVSRYGAAGLAAGMAAAQLIFNCGWFSLAACRASGTSPAALVRAWFHGMLWPIAVLALETLIARVVWLRLSPLELVIFGVFSGVVYLAFWGLRTALPLYRGYAEVALQ